MAITKAEYLSALQAEVVTTKQKREKSTKRKRIIAMVLGFGTVAFIGLGSAGTSIERTNNFKRFSAGEISASFELLNSEGAFDIWNSQSLGNNINTILGGGKVYARGESTVLPAEEGYQVCVNGEINGFIPGDISYINVYENAIFYRDDLTRSICVYDMQSAMVTPVIDSNIGELLISDGRLYFVDRSDGSKLVSTTVVGEDRQVIVDKPVTSFAVCGDETVYLSTDQTLYRKNVSHESETTLMSNIERFFLNGNIVAESGDSVFQFTAERSNAALLYQSNDLGMQLVGACSSGFFVQDTGRLLFSDGSTAFDLPIGSHRLYQSVAVDTDGTIYCIGVSAIDDIQLVKSSLPELKEGD